MLIRPTVLLDSDIGVPRNARPFFDFGGEVGEGLRDKARSFMRRFSAKLEVEVGHGNLRLVGIVGGRQ